MHQFEVGEEKVWYRGFTSSVTREQECLVEYEPLEDETEEDSSYIDKTWVGPVLQDYLHNDLGL